MSIRSKIWKAAFNRHIWIEKINPKVELLNFLSRFRKHYVSCDLIRIGGNGDGGYLLPNIFDNISYCFSPGVSYTANFEKELSRKFQIKSFMADASVSKPPMLDKNFDFIPKFLGTQTIGEFITLSDWLNQSKISPTENMILQMDIEGGEYDVLMYEDSLTLKSFSAMIIEFHYLQKLFKSDFRKIVSAVFEKIYKNFSICHVHPNNCCGVTLLDGIAIPSAIEVSFIRNDLVHNFSNKTPINLPHKLDFKNVADKEDIFMPELWYKNV